MLRDCLEITYQAQRLLAWVASHRNTGNLSVEIVSRTFGYLLHLVPRHLIVERTFSRPVRNQRLVRDYEVPIRGAQGWFYVRLIGLL